MRLIKTSSLLFILQLTSVPAFCVEPVERQVYLMGTILKVAVYEPNRRKALVELERMVAIVEKAEKQLSNWRAGSELSAINEQPVGQPLKVSASLFSLLEKLHLWVRKTEGCFDPGVGSLIRVWGIHHDATIPDARIVRAALMASGFDKLGFDRAHQTVTRTAAITLDAGAFGKGEALDRVLQTAKEENLPPLLLDFGGQIAVWKDPPIGSMAVAQPDLRDQASSIRVFLKQGSLSTSGGSEQDAVVHGKTIGHIVDPKTGYPVPSFGSVTVWAQDALSADILSTALYVMGPVKGSSWAEKNQVAACFLSKNSVRMTRGFEQLIATR